MATITLRPTSSTGSYWTNIANAYDTDSSTSATVSVSASNYSWRTATFNFDTSKIPSNATITSATLTIRCMASTHNGITLYADINGDSTKRVLNSSCSSTLGNKMVSVTSYMSNLNSIKLTGYNSSYGSYTLSIYDISISVSYELATTYTVTFKDWNGTTLKTQTVQKGSSATPPSNPTRTGYTFTGWSGSYTNVQSNVTITAQYSINTYTVTFKDWNGTVLKTQTVNYGNSATAPTNPTRDGYRFTGWDRVFTNVTSNLTVTAQYSINTYTVTFKDWDGTTLKTQTVNYGSNATPPSNPTRDGYEFTGWDRAFDNVTSDLTITAQYTYININKLHIGELLIDKLYIGNSQVNKVYIGETLLYSFSSSPPADYIIVSASTNLLEVDSESTAVAIELTSSNFSSRINEVLPYFPSCTDLYLFDDGSVTSLYDMMYETYTIYKSQIKKVVFLDGYFNNLTEMYSTFFGCTSLTQVPTIPQGVTDMGYTFSGCTSLTQAPNIPSSVTSMYGTFYNCSSLTTGPKISSTIITDFSMLYYGCTKLSTCDVPIYANTCNNALRNVPSTCDITWIGERTTNLNVTSTLYYNNPNATDIQELVTEHLADLTELGTTATLTLGSTNLAYLSSSVKTQATNKGWTLQ